MPSSALQLLLVTVELITVCSVVLAMSLSRLSVLFLRGAVIASAVSITYRYGWEFANEAITSFRAAMHFPPPYVYWAIFLIPAACSLFFVVTCFTPNCPRIYGVVVFVLLSVFSVWFAHNAGLGGMLLWNLSAPFSMLPLFLAWALHQERQWTLTRERANQTTQQTALDSAV
jgi:hypothetical protein